MPEICRFYGIVIKMYFGDDNPPHFHAQYGDTEALIDIRHVAVFAGALPGRALGLVVEWTWLHRDELIALWDKARRCEPLNRIDPLA